MMVLCILLAMLSLFLSLKLICQRKLVQKVKKQIDFLIDRDTQTEIMVEKTDGTIQDLAASINHLLKKYRSMGPYQQRREPCGRDYIDNQSLSHSRYNCTYHIVFIPKYRRKVMFGNLRKEIGEAISKVCKMEGVTIIKAATLPDHVHMYVSIPPKENVSKVVGRIKGKSSLILFDRHPEYRERYNRHFWARGYYCETIGNVDEATITKYIAEQYERDRLEGEIS